MELIMYSSILSAIILCLVGLIKLPFKPFKGKNFYKAGLTLLTIVITLGMCVICELFIIGESIWSIGMIYLTLITFGEVMLTYNGVYEGFGVKQICQELFTNIGRLIFKTPESKLAKSAEKYGLEKAIEHLNQLALEKAQKEAEEQAKKLEEQQPVEVK